MLFTKTLSSIKLGGYFKIFLVIGLTGAMILIFILQKDYFTEELNDKYLGFGVLVVILLFEFISHYILFKLRETLAKIFFGILSAMLIFFSMFVNFSVQVSLSKNSLSQVKANRSIQNQSNSSIVLKRKLARERLESISKQVNQKMLTIKAVTGTKRAWMISKLNKEIVVLNKEWKLEKTALLNLSNEKKLIITNYTILESIEKITGIKVLFISLSSKGVISFLLSIVPFTFCYFLVKGTVLAPEEDENENDTDNDDYDEEEELIPAAVEPQIKEDNVPTIQAISYPMDQSTPKQNMIQNACSRLGIGKDELAKKLNISTGFLAGLELKKTLPPTIKAKIEALIK